MNVLKKTLVYVSVAVLFVLFTALYVVTLRGVTGNPSTSQMIAQENTAAPFELSPERGRYAHVVALAETGKYELSQDLANFVYPDVGWFQGRFYSFFAPGLAYMVAPFYMLGAHVGMAQLFSFGAITLAALASLLLLVVIAVRVLKLPLWAGLTAALVFGFATTSWSYAITLYQHHVTLFLLLSGFLAAWKFANSNNKLTSFACAAWVWTAYGIAIFIDYPNALLLAPVIVYFFNAALSQVKDAKRWAISLRPAFVLSSIFFFLLIGLHGYHNQKEFGSWKRVSGGIVGYKTIRENGLEGLPTSELVEKLASAQARKDNVVAFFSEQRIPNSFGTLLFSKDRGLAVYSPLVLLGLLGLGFMFKRFNPEVGFLAGTVAANIFLYSSWGDPWGGWAYGPRYLIPTMAVSALGLAYAFARAPKAWIFRLVAVPFFVYSAGIALLGAITSNAIPPRLEADALKAPYNFVANYKWLHEGLSGSYVYNSYLKAYVSLPHLFVTLLIGITVLFVLLAVVAPLFKKQGGQHV